MENLVGAVEAYSDFVASNEEYRTSDYFVRCLADAVVNYWHTLLFVSAEGLDRDDAAKAEEALIYFITNAFSDAENVRFDKRQGAS